MKIDSVVQHVASIQNKGVKSKSAKDNAGPGVSSSVSDNVEITDTSARMRELERQLADQPPEDADKVSTIRQALADGSFSVDEEAVAEGMVREAIEQLRHHQSR